jgi:hypothetical protein
MVLISLSWLSKVYLYTIYTPNPSGSGEERSYLIKLLNSERFIERTAIYFALTSRKRSEVNPSSACYVLYHNFLPDLFVYPEDWGDMIFWNVGWLSEDYMALCSSIRNYSVIILRQ